jgi:hypothetical protein
MSQSETLNSILTILKEMQITNNNQFASLEKKLVQQGQQGNQTFEVVETTYQIAEDVGKKFDMVLNVGVKKPKLAPIKKNECVVESEKPKNKQRVEKAVPTLIIRNILRYFKVRYTEDNTVFNSILEENQAEAVFKEHAAAINAKKNDADKQKERANLLYKNLSESQKKKIREKMNDENEAAVINNDDDIEPEQIDAENV